MNMGVRSTLQRMASGASYTSAQAPRVSTGLKTVFSPVGHSPFKLSIFALFAGPVLSYPVDRVALMPGFIKAVKMATARTDKQYILRFLAGGSAETTATVLTAYDHCGGLGVVRSWLSPVTQENSDAPAASSTFDLVRQAMAPLADNRLAQLILTYTQTVQTKMKSPGTNAPTIVPMGDEHGDPASRKLRREHELSMRIVAAYYCIHGGVGIGAMGFSPSMSPSALLINSFIKTDDAGVMIDPLPSSLVEVAAHHAHSSRALPSNLALLDRLADDLLSSSTGDCQEQQSAFLCALSDIERGLLRTFLLHVVGQRSAAARQAVATDLCTPSAGQKRPRALTGGTPVWYDPLDVLRHTGSYALACTSNA